MSQENVEQYKREQWEAITKAGNTRELDSVAGILDPDVEFRSLISVAEGQEVYVGIDGWGGGRMT